MKAAEESPSPPAHRTQALPNAAPSLGVGPAAKHRRAQPARNSPTGDVPRPGLQPGAGLCPQSGAPAGPAHAVGPPRSLHAPLRRARLNKETPIVPGREERGEGRVSRENSFPTRMRVSCHHPRIAASSDWHANTGTRDRGRLLYESILPLHMKEYRQAADAEEPKLHRRADMRKKKSTFFWHMDKTLGNNCAGRKGSWTHRLLSPLRTAGGARRG